MTGLSTIIWESKSWERTTWRTGSGRRQRERKRGLSLAGTVTDGGMAGVTRHIDNGTRLMGTVTLLGRKI